MDSIPIFQPSLDIGSSSSEPYFSPNTTSWILFGLIIAVVLLFIIFLIIVIKPKSTNVVYTSSSSGNGEFDFLTVNNQSNLNGGVIVGPTSSSLHFYQNELRFTPTNRFDVHYDTFFTENVSMTKNASVDGTMAVSGNTTLQGLTVNGGSTINGGSVYNGNTSFNQNVTVYGTSSFVNPTSIGSLTVRGNSILQGNLGVTGTATFNDVNVTGNLSLQNASLQTLGVTGTTNLYGPLTVKGVSNLETTNIRTLGVLGTSIFTGNSTFNNNLTIKGNLGVTGTVSFKDFNVNGSSTFNQDIIVKKGIDFINLNDSYPSNPGSIYFQDNQMNIQGGTGGISLLDNIGASILDFEETSISAYRPISANDITIREGTLTSEFITLGQSEQKYKMSANIAGSTDFTIESISGLGLTGGMIMDFTRDAKKAYLLGGYTGGTGNGLFVGPNGARGQVYDSVYNPPPSVGNNPSFNSVTVSGTGTFGKLIISDDSNKIQSFGMNYNIGYYPTPKPIFDSAGGRWYGRIYNYKFLAGIGTFYTYPINEWSVSVTGIKSHSLNDNSGTYFYVYPDVSGYWYFSITHIGGNNIESDPVIPAINFLAIPSGLVSINTTTMIQS